MKCASGPYFVVFIVWLAVSSYYQAPTAGNPRKWNFQKFKDLLKAWWAIWKVVLLIGRRNLILRGSDSVMWLNAHASSSLAVCYILSFDPLAKYLAAKIFNTCIFDMVICIRLSIMQPLVSFIFHILHTKRGTNSREILGRSQFSRLTVGACARISLQ